VGCGYEIHMGQTRRHGGGPCFQVRERNGIPCDDDDGCVTSDGRIMGTYIHGLFENPVITRLWLNIIGLAQIEISEFEGLAAKDREYDRLAEYFETHIDTQSIMGLISKEIRSTPKNQNIQRGA
jgi:adenosylcobyric acid synthase